MEKRDITILMIDDNFDNLIILQALIIGEFPQARIILAKSGKEGIAFAYATKPDVILLDIVMPELDGFDVCKKIKSDEKLCDIPVIFITAIMDNPKSRLKGFEVGGEAFLAKPFDKDELISSIHKLVIRKYSNEKPKNNSEKLSNTITEQKLQIAETYSATLNLLEDLKAENEARKQSEEALHASEALYRSILEASPDNITVTDLTGKILMISPKGLNLVGYKFENEIIGRYLGDFLAPEDVNRGIKNIEGMFSGVFNGPEEYKILNANGEKIDVEINAEFVKNIEGNPTKIVFAIRDIRERKLSLEALQNSEIRYRTLVENSPTGIAVHQNGKFVYVNSAGMKIFGTSKQEDLVGRPVLSIVHSDSMEAVIKRVSLVVAGNKLPPLEEKLIRIDGSVFYAEVTAISTTFNGLPAGQVIVTDITDRKKAQVALEESEKKYRFITEKISDVVWLMDLTGKSLFVSQSIETFTGFTVEEYLNQSFSERYTEESAEIAFTEFKKELDSYNNQTIKPPKKESRLTLNYRCKNGEIKTGEILITPYLDAENNLIGLHGVTRDITKRTIAEMALKESEEKYFNLYTLLRLMSDTMPDMLWAKDLDGKFLFANKAMCDNLLCASDTNEPIGNTDVYFAQKERSKHPENSEWHTFGELCSNTDTITLNEMQKMQFDEVGNVRGEFLFLDVHKAPLFNERNELIGIVGSGRDITQQKKSEEKLRESEEKFRLLANLLPQIVFETDSNGNLSYVNKQAYKICGYAEDEILIGSNTINLYVPEDRERAIENVKRKLSGEDFTDSEYTMIRKDGTTFPVLVYSNPVYKDGKPAGLRGIIVDISDRKLIEDKLNHVARMYALLGEINQAVTKIHERDTLLKRICEIAIESGKFRMAWVGSVDEGKKRVIPKTFAGFEDGYLENIEIPTDMNSPIKGPSAVAITTKEVAYCNDISTDPLMLPWRDEALKRGYNSIASVPINCANKVYGMFTFYASEINFFTEEEIYLLNKIGDDISYALDAIEAEKERDVARQLLLASEEKYRELMENSPEGITIYVDGKVAYINKEALRLMNGSDKSEMLGKTIVDFIHPENREAVLERMKLVAMAPINAVLPSVEEKYVRLDGTEVDVEIKVMPIIFEGNHAFQLSGHDITDRKKAEIALAQSRTELKTIYDNAPVIMCVVDEQRQIKFANNAFEQLTGFSDENTKNGILGGVIKCIHSFDNPQGCGFGSNCGACNLRQALDETHRTGNGFTNIEYNTTLKIGNGKRDIYLLGSTALIDTKDSKNILLCLHDITDRKKAEEALQNSEVLLRTFIDNSPFEIWARDTENVGILENKKLVDHYGSIIGIKAEEDERIDKKMQNYWIKSNKKAFSGEIVDEEFEFDLKGSKRNFQQIIFPIINKEKTLGIAGFNIDITERKAVENALKESQEQLKKFAAHLQNIREDERSLLARDIHDDLGQILIAMKIDLGLLRNNVIKALKPKDAEKMTLKFLDLQKLVDNTLQSARRIMTDLRPEVLDLLGFIDTVNQHINSFGNRNKIECNFTSNINGLELTSQQSVALFRIVQETLNNTAKHANATKVDIDLNQTKDNLILEIADNGIGFNVNDKKKMDSYGLLGMKERVFLLGGELQISSTKNVGTTIKVVLNNKDLIITNI